MQDLGTCSLLMRSSSSTYVQASEKVHNLKFSYFHTIKFHTVSALANPLVMLRTLPHLAKCKDNDVHIDGDDTKPSHSPTKGKTSSKPPCKVQGRAHTLKNQGHHHIFSPCLMHAHSGRNAPNAVMLGAHAHLKTKRSEPLSVKISKGHNPFLFCIKCMLHLVSYVCCTLQSVPLTKLSHYLAWATA